MADSDITVSGLTSIGGPLQVKLTWDTPLDPHTPGGLPDLQLEAVEIHSSPVNDRSTAVKIGEQPAANEFIHAGLTRAETNYYWIKPRDRSGLYGEWFPISDVDGVEGTEANNNVLIEENGYWEVRNGLLFQWGSAVITGPRTEGAAQTVPFTIPFPNECFSVIPSPKGVTERFNSSLSAWTNGWGLSSFECYAAEQNASTTSWDDDIPITWFAVGY